MNATVFQYTRVFIMATLFLIPLIMHNLSADSWLECLILQRSYKEKKMEFIAQWEGKPNLSSNCSLRDWGKFTFFLQNHVSLPAPVGWHHFSSV